MDESSEGEEIGPAPALHLDPGLLFPVETGDHPLVAEIGEGLPDLLQIILLIVKNEFMPEEALEKSIVVADPVQRKHIFRACQNRRRYKTDGEKIMEDVVLVVLEVHPFLVPE